MSCIKRLKYPETAIDMDFRHLIIPLLLWTSIGWSQSIGSGESESLDQRIERESSPSSIVDGTPWRKTSLVSKKRLYLFWGSIALFEPIVIIRFKKMWYQYPTTSFHFLNFKEDIRRNRQMDKLGHLMTSYAASDFASKAYRWAGFSVKKSVLYGSLTAWLWILQIELADGFFERWGFGWGDLCANTVGAGFSAIRQLYPNTFRGIQLKLSYHKSIAFKEKLYDPLDQNMINDYEGMTFWLAFNLYDCAPEAIKSRFPSWLAPIGVAVGYSAKGIVNDIMSGKREIFIGLNIDLRKINIGNSSNNRWLNFLKSELDLIRLPLPAVRISGDVRWYGIYF